MRTIKYRRNFGVGENSSPWENCDLNEFSDYCPDFGFAVYVIKVIPSLTVLNDLFNSGQSDAAIRGGAQWKSFEIDTAEYDLLVESLCSKPDYDIKLDTILINEKTFKEWHKKALHEYNPRKRHDS